MDALDFSIEQVLQRACSACRCVPGNRARGGLRLVQEVVIDAGPSPRVQVFTGDEQCLTGEGIGKDMFSGCTNDRARSDVLKNERRRENQVMGIWPPPVKDANGACAWSNWHRTERPGRDGECLRQGCWIVGQAPGQIGEKR